jgi:hypothetical protein
MEGAVAAEGFMAFTDERIIPDLKNWVDSILEILPKLFYVKTSRCL